MRKLEKQVVVHTSICHGLVHVLELTYGVVLISISQEFSASLLVLGVLANIAGFAFGATALPAGFLADRISEKNLLIFCALGMAISSAAVGLSANIPMLAGALFILGLALGIYHPTGAAFVARVVTQRGLGFGYLGIGGNLGIALGPVLAGIIASTFGWRAAYLTLAIPPLLLAVVLFVTIPREISKTNSSASPVESGKASLRPVILPLALIFGAQVLNGFIYRGAVTFLPIYLSQRISFTLFNMDTMLIAGSFTTIALIFGVAGQFLGGYLSERRRLESLAFGLAVPAVPILLAVGNTEGMTLLLAAITFAFFHFMAQPVYNSLVAEYSPARWRGRMYGISFFCTFGVGSFSASILGYVADKMGTNWAFIASAGFGLLIIFCTTALLLRPPHASRADTPPSQ